MEADLDYAQAVMNAINGFNELERQAMSATIVVNPRPHCILPLYDMLYTDKDGELWFFEEDGHLTRKCTTKHQGGESGRGACLDSS